MPEPRTGKTRVHLDVRLPEPDPAPLLAAGATLVSEPDGERHWWVLADPEGNEFCVALAELLETRIKPALAAQAVAA